MKFYEMNIEDKLKYIEEIISQNNETFFTSLFLEYTKIYFGLMEGLTVAQRLDTKYFNMNLEEYLRNISIKSLKELQNIVKIERYQKEIDNFEKMTPQQFSDSLASATILLNRVMK